MKRIFLTAGVIMMAATVTFAHNNRNRKGDTPPNDVSNRTKVQFQEDFPYATDINYVRTANFDEVSFMSGKEKVLKSYYDENSDLVGTTQNESFADLPGNAQKQILKYYADYSIVRVVKFHAVKEEDDGLEMLESRSEFDNPDNYFVELKNNNKAIVVEVSLSGDVGFYTTMR